MKTKRVLLAMGILMALGSTGAWADLPPDTPISPGMEVVTLGVSFYTEVCQKTEPGPTPPPGGIGIPGGAFCSVPGTLLNSVEVLLKPIDNGGGGLGSVEESRGTAVWNHLASNGEKFLGTLVITKRTLSGVQYYLFDVSIEDKYQRRSSMSFSVDRMSDLRSTTLRGTSAGNEKVWANPVLYISRAIELVPGPPTTVPPTPGPAAF